MKRFVLFAAIGMAVAVGAPSTARGDAPLPPAAKAQAQLRYSKGNELYKRAMLTHDASAFEAAYLQYAQAYAIYPDDKVLWNLSMSEVETQRLLPAIRHFRTYEDHQHSLENERHPHHAALRDYLDKLNAQMSRIEVEAPIGAGVFVDGETVGVAPLTAPVDVLPGTHDVSTNLNGSVSHANVDLSAGAQKSVRVGFVEAAPSAPPPVASVRPRTPPPPVEEAHEAPSQHRSFFTPRNTIVLGLGVGAAAAITAGIVFRVQASDNKSTESSLASQTGMCPGSSGCAALSQFSNDRSSDNNKGTAFLAVGGALLVTGAGMLIFWHDAPADTPKPSANLVPLIGPSVAGAQLSGTF